MSEHEVSPADSAAFAESLVGQAIAAAAVEIAPDWEGHTTCAGLTLTLGDGRVVSVWPLDVQGGAELIIELTNPGGGA